MITPSIWPTELANVLVVAERRQRITIVERQRFLARVQRLPILVQPAPDLPAVASVLDLAHRYSLSAYDASYLQVALQEKLPLATQDKRLRAAAQSAGVLFST